MSRGRRGQRASHAASALLLHTPASSPPKPPPMKLGGCKDGGGGAPSPSLVVKPDGTPARQELRLGAGDEEKRPAAARSGAVEAGSGPPWQDLLGGGVGSRCPGWSLNTLLTLISLRCRFLTGAGEKVWEQPHLAPMTCSAG
ncbi:hypothetical protein OsI_29043 [Oryza sativa Indica Group]|uniref:Uncharacterized protein n=1 Tax=Oryza sativa subsp. indica TaxID=39946 RepID=B8BAA5_ORYSI|nr:hypothetical protein OsI_29043 [Oryza sativa Indica Group]